MAARWAERVRSGNGVREKPIRRTIGGREHEAPADDRYTGTVTRGTHTTKHACNMLTCVGGHDGPPLPNGNMVQKKWMEPSKTRFPKLPRRVMEPNKQPGVRSGVRPTSTLPASCCSHVLSVVFESALVQRRPGDKGEAFR